jgi:hypothetical protein
MGILTDAEEKGEARKDRPVFFTTISQPLGNIY